MMTNFNHFEYEMARQAANDTGTTIVYIDTFYWRNIPVLRYDVDGSLVYVVLALRPYLADQFSSERGRAPAGLTLHTAIRALGVR